jgi:hypothetical protein
MGDEVGIEKASCVEDIAWPFRELCELSDENSEASQPMLEKNDLGIVRQRAYGTNAVSQVVDAGET